MLITRSSVLDILTNIHCTRRVTPLPHNHHMTYSHMIRLGHKEKIEINEPSKMMISHLSFPPIGGEAVRWWGCWPLIGGLRRTNNCLGREEYCHKYLFSVFFHRHMDLQYANSDTLIHPRTTQKHRNIFKIYFLYFKLILNT